MQGFDDHVKMDHNMWRYIYFSIYLDTIDTSDHNAIEKYVYEMVRMSYTVIPAPCYDSVSLQISEGKIDFFPVLQAQCLETEEDETAKQLESLRTMVTSVLERFKEEVGTASSELPASELALLL